MIDYIISNLFFNLKADKFSKTQNAYEMEHILD